MEWHTMSAPKNVLFTTSLIKAWKTYLWLQINHSSEIGFLNNIAILRKIFFCTLEIKNAYYGFVQHLDNDDDNKNKLFFVTSGIMLKKISKTLNTMF